MIPTELADLQASETRQQIAENPQVNGHHRVNGTDSSAMSLVPAEACCRLTAQLVRFVHDRGGRKRSP